MISDWQFEDADKLVGPALDIAPAIMRLKARCHEAGVPVLYVNDHHGEWRTDFAGVIARSLAQGGQGSEITAQLRPDADDYFVLKPMHSAFYATPLEILLRHLHVRRVIVVGVTADQCVFLTAAGARMRDFDVWVPSDAVASQSTASHGIGPGADRELTPDRYRRMRWDRSIGECQSGASERLSSRCSGQGDYGPPWRPA